MIKKKILYFTLFELLRSIYLGGVVSAENIPGVNKINCTIKQGNAYCYGDLGKNISVTITDVDSDETDEHTSESLNKLVDQSFNPKMLWFNYTLLPPGEYTFDLMLDNKTIKTLKIDVRKIYLSEPEQSLKK